MFQRELVENESLNAIISKEFQDALPVDRDVISIPEWRDAYESFRNFPYSNPRARVQDMDIMSSIGFYTLSASGHWPECLELIEWVLSDKQFIDAHDRIARLHYWKALCLLNLLSVSDALDYFLGSVSPFFKQPNQNQVAYLFGIHLFMAAKSKLADSKEDAIPRDIINFAQEIFAARYPKKKPPRILRNHEKIEDITWGEVHEALAKYFR